MILMTAPTGFFLINFRYKFVFYLMDHYPISFVIKQLSLEFCVGIQLTEIIGTSLCRFFLKYFLSNF